MRGGRRGTPVTLLEPTGADVEEDDPEMPQLQPVFVSGETESQAVFGSDVEMADEEEQEGSDCFEKQIVTKEEKGKLDDDLDDYIEDFEAHMVKIEPKVETEDEEELEEEEDHSCVEELDPCPETLPSGNELVIEYSKVKRPVVPEVLEEGAVVQCQHCPLQVAGAAAWRRHMLQRHGLATLIEDSYVCFCGYSTEDADAAAAHVRTRREQSACAPLRRALATPTACPLCGGKWPTAAKLHRHLLEGHMRRFTCTACDLAAADRTFLELHVLAHQDVQLHTSPLCAFQSLSAEALRAHLELHPGQYVCHVCSDRAFPNACQLRRHLLLEHEPVPLPVSDDRKRQFNLCAACFAHFDTPQQLRAHLDACTKTRPSLQRRGKAPRLAPRDPLAVGDSKLLLRGDAPLDIPAPWLDRLVPDADFNYEESGDLRCQFCFCVVHNKSDARLHLLAHTTECCAKCNFTEGVVSPCPDHRVPPSDGSIRKGHLMGLLDKGLERYVYACTECTLETHEELDPQVSCRFRSCADCRFSSACAEASGLHALHHSSVPVQMLCLTCGAGPFATPDDFSQHFAQPHQLRPLEVQLEPRDRDAAYVFQCPHCPWEGRAGVESHLRGHALVTCGRCQTTVGGAKLQAHLRAHHDAEASAGRKSRRRLLRVQVVLKEGLFTCRLCGATFTDESLCDEHVLLEHTHLCGVCRRSHVNRRQLLQHVAQAHPELPDDVTCGRCPFVSFNEDALKSHRMIHKKLPTQRFVCKICGTWRLSAQWMQEHMDAVHVVEGHASCASCVTTFSGVQELCDHWSRAHAAEECRCSRCVRPEGAWPVTSPQHLWACDFCGAEMPDEAEAQKHIAEFHLDSHFCTSCDEILRTPLSFANHARTTTHTNIAKRLADKEERAKNKLPPPTPIPLLFR